MTMPTGGLTADELYNAWQTHRVRGHSEDDHDGCMPECAEDLFADLAEQALPGVDQLAQVIRIVDGDNALGAGALAEAIVAYFSGARR
jgi:hypothetical protein